MLKLASGHTIWIEEYGIFDEIVDIWGSKPVRRMKSLTPEQARNKLLGLIWVIYARQGDVEEILRTPTFRTRNAAEAYIAKNFVAAE